MNCIDRPDFIPLEIWDWLPAFPFEFSGLAAFLPLPRFILKKIPGPKFRLTDLVISPKQVGIGQVVTISVTVTNTWSKEGTGTVVCRVEGKVMAEQTVTLAPGESRTISFQVTPTVAKTYSVSVDGLTGSFKAVAAPVADIKVENLVIEPAEVQIGQTVTISVTATNYGTASGSKTIVCQVT